jgi:hypothetical protein
LAGGCVNSSAARRASSARSSQYRASVLTLRTIVPPITQQPHNATASVQFQQGKTRRGECRKGAVEQKHDLAGLTNGGGTYHSPLQAGQHGVKTNLVEFSGALVLNPANPYSKHGSASLGLPASRGGEAVGCEPAIGLETRPSTHSVFRPALLVLRSSALPFIHARSFRPPPPLDEFARLCHVNVINIDMSSPWR